MDRRLYAIPEELEDLGSAPGWVETLLGHVILRRCGFLRQYCHSCRNYGKRLRKVIDLLSQKAAEMA
jgi:hypothetical protein